MYTYIRGGIKMKKKITLMLVFSIALSVLVGCAPKAPGAGTPAEDAKPISIKLGHAMSEGTQSSKLIHEFAVAVTEKTNGRVTIDDFPNNMLGNESEMLEQMKMGSLEAAAIMVGTMQSMDMKLAIEDLPYMWKDIQHARDAYNGEFGKAISDIVSAQGFHGISYIEWGFRHITNNVRPIVNPEDLSGIKIRVAQTKMRVDTFEALGAMPQVLSFSELYGALQSNVVDAQENPLGNIAAAKFSEVQKYLSLTGHFYNTAMLMFTDEVWSQISDEDKAIIEEEAAIVSKKVTEFNDQEESAYVEQLKQEGMIVNDDVNKAAFIEKTRGVYEKWESEVFGKELMDIYRAASGY